MLVFVSEYIVACKSMHIYRTEDKMKFLSYKKLKNIKRAVAITLVAAFLLSLPTGNGNNVLSFVGMDEFFASPYQERDEAQDELNNVENEMDDLENQKDELESQLSEKAQLLSELLADQELLERDIASTQVEIDQAKIDLENAKEKEQEEYESMKLRIKYMYENSTQDSFWTAIIEAKGVADMLNRVEYVTQVHKTDRELLEGYKAVVAEVETLAAELDSKMNDLVALQEIYEHQQVELETAMAELKEEVDDYADQLAAARRRASELADYIEEQNRKIQEEEERRRREEEERRRQEEEQKRKEEEEKRKEEEEKDKDDKEPDKDKEEDKDKDDDKDPDFTSNVTGSELVNYALQFVGNPYVWGGNSLTNGCDCSGFVHLVYKHFGFTLPRYSQAFKTVGKPVSFNNLKAGDIVVYPGHVAIYIGNGNIVEAQSSKAGITSYRKVTCNTITAIRRVL